MRFLANGSKKQVIPVKTIAMNSSFRGFVCLMAWIGLLLSVGSLAWAEPDTSDSHASHADHAAHDSHAAHRDHSGHSESSEGEGESEAQSDQLFSGEEEGEGEPESHRGIEVLSIFERRPDRTVEKWVDVRSEKRPEGDGADVLKGVPGFNLIRQGGIGSDPVFRGLSGSRLNVLIDGVPYGGACNHAMDPPTSYVNPGEFSQLLVLAGPQSVRNAGTVAGAVDFERSRVQLDEWGAQVFATGVLGSFDLNEFSGDVAFGGSPGYVRLSGGYEDSGDYLDGNGDPVLSRYNRWNGRVALGWTPGEDTLLELSAEMSDGKMANATIHMDSVKLDRKVYGARFKKTEMDSWLDGIEVQFNRISVDHAMDDFSFRPFAGPEAEFPALFVPIDTLIMGQTWDEYFGRVAFYLEPLEDLVLEVGTTMRYTEYSARADSATSIYQRLPGEEEYQAVFEDLASLDDVPSNPILDFLNMGAYVEMSYGFMEGSRIVAGARYDRFRTETQTMRAAGETSSVILSGSNQQRNQNLWSGFVRYEKRFQDFPILAAVGLGHAERPHDYWEVYSYDGFGLAPEKNTEFDATVYYGGERLTGSTSFFLSQIDDYIVTFNGIEAFNVEARRAGMEALVTYRILPELLVSAEMAFVFAENRTQGTPLAQTPPVEGSVAIRYEGERFEMGAVTRLVAPQDRIHPDYGSRLGVDTTPSPGFVVLSADASFRPWSFVDVSVGIQNILNQNYYEHLSRVESPVPGFPNSGLKINEPGRNFWIRVSLDLDI